VTEFYERLLEDDWKKLPEIIRDFHQTGASLTASGDFRVMRGTNPIARLLAALAMLPPEEESVRLRLVVTSIGNGEIWAREFGTWRMASAQREAAPRTLGERFGMMELYFRLEADNGVLRYVDSGAALNIGPIRIRLPGALAPHGAGSETVSQDGKGIEAKIRMSLPLVGLLIAYEGVIHVEAAP
jgi:hypothetical protein